MAPRVVEFRLETDGQGHRVVVPFVDGISLVDIVELYESARSYAPAGGYGGIPVRYVIGDPEAYYGGRTWLDPGRTWLLGCDCGEPGCWPLEASVVVDDGSVTWQGFEQPFRSSEWSYVDFGPFRFDRAHYTDAVHALRARVTDQWAEQVP